MSRRPVTMQDIATELGVSRALVSMAFRDVAGVNAQTRQTVLDTAVRMGYRFNRVASRLASRVTNTYGVFLLDLRLDVYADMFDGIRKVADADDKQLVLAVGSNDGTRDSEALDSLLQSRVDIIIATGLLLPDAPVRALNEQVPIVSIARQIDGVDSVHSDNIAGARAATRHLLELGHRRIAFLSNPQTDGYLGRRIGYVETMASAGLSPWVIDSHYSRAQAEVDVAPALALPDWERPTAVFAHNDQAALGVLDALAALGLRAPSDVSVVGYDNSMVSQAPGTQLTTVDIHGEQLGRQAAEVAARRLAEPETPPINLISPPSLVIRGTTGPPAGL